MATKTEWQKLQPILAKRGLLTDKGTSRYVHARPCKDCGHTILAGIDWEFEAMQPAREIQADLDPITAAGELAALMLGRTTYDLRDDPATGRWKLHSRTEWARLDSPYRRNPIGEGQKWDVVAAHECGTSLPTKDTIVPPRRVYDDLSEPPF